MKVLVSLFDTNTKADDGSVISRTVVEQYLASEDYRYLIQNRLALGGVTHKDRKIAYKWESIGEDDPMLIEDNLTHYITRIFFRDETDPVCYAEIEIFDPEEFSGARKDNIINLRGMLNSKVKLPISVVIQGDWDHMENCKKIHRIKGLDFTINPSFDGAGVIKVFSSIPKSRLRIGNTKGVKIFTKVSLPIPIEKDDDAKELTDLEYKLKYGNKPAGWNPRIEDEPTEHTPVESDEEIKSYSTVSSIHSRLRMKRYDVKYLFRRIMRLYTYYYKINADSLTEAEVKYLKFLFIQDINLVIRSLTPYIRKSAHFGSRLGLNNYDRELAKSSYALGLSYKRVLMVEKTMKFIPKNIYNTWLKDLENFYGRCLTLVFGNSEYDFDRVDSVMDKTYSENDESEEFKVPQYITAVELSFSIPDSLVAGMKYDEDSNINI